MSLFIDGWLKQKQIHQSVKSHIIFHHLAINHRCECECACMHIHVYVCNLITQQLTDLHNRYLVISLNLSVVYFGSDWVLYKQMRKQLQTVWACVCLHACVSMTLSPRRMPLEWSQLSQAEFAPHINSHALCVVIDSKVELVLYSSSSSECAQTRHAGQDRNNAGIWEEREKCCGSGWRREEIRKNADGFCVEL